MKQVAMYPDLTVKVESEVDKVVKINQLHKVGTISRLVGKGGARQERWAHTGLLRL